MTFMQRFSEKLSGILRDCLLYFVVLAMIRTAELLIFSGTKLNLFNCTVIPREEVLLPWIFPWVLAGLAAFLLCRSLVSGEREKFCRSFFPILPALILPENYFISYPVSMFLTGWGVFRFLCTRDDSLPAFLHGEATSVEKKILPYAVLLLYAAASAWGFFLQEKAYRTLFLGYADWAFYAEGYFDLIRQGTWKGYLSIGAHWNGAVNWFMVLCLRIAPFPQTIFLINSLVLYSAIPAGFLCCRKWNVSERLTLLLMILIALNPVYCNLNLCLFYGFHPVYFAIPAVLLFFYFRESGSKPGMWLCFLYTLFVQETMFIFWTGYALWLLWNRRWITGSILAAGCAAGFLLISSVILPELSGTAEYAQINVGYAHLGNNFREIALSPVTKPAVFWSGLFHWRNLLFAGMLLLPFFFIMVGKFFSMILIVLPILFGVFLKGDPSVKIILLQYSLEGTLIFTAASLLNFRDRNFSLPRGFAFLHAGLKTIPSSRKMQTALLCGALIVSLLAFHCFAYSFAGKNSFNNVLDRQEQISVLKEFEEKIPENARVLSSFRMRPFFAFRHRTGNFPDPRHAGDFVVLTLQDPVMDNPKLLEETRKELALSPNAVPVLAGHSGWSDYLLYRITDDPVLMRGKLKLTRMTEEEFSGTGTEIFSPDPAFAVRYHYNGMQHQFSIRLQKTPSYDVDFFAVVRTENGELAESRSFAGGIYPANTQSPGTMTFITIPGPPAKEIQLVPAKRIGYR